MATTKKSAASKAGAVKRSSRMGVLKTYKLYVGGKFPRSESGRSIAIAGSNGVHLANVAQASRKDAREAVVAARKAFGGWSGATAYNRGQILYRIAEMLDGRRDQFIAELVSVGTPRPAAEREVEKAIDLWIYYAGFADKYAQVVGAANPVAAPYFNFSLPEPTGVVAIVAPPESALRGLTAVLAPALAAGNTTVVVASERNPLSAMSFAEVLATSDVPGGTVNILTGYVDELAPVLAGHMDVNAIDLQGVPSESIAALETVAVENLKRVVRPRQQLLTGKYSAGTVDAMLPFVEIKTVWHPIGV
jgi:acyl-CoA reductase-like NAD-dependent aldehyde dehydrogenase